MAGKGSGFERDVCRQLSTWWTGDPEEDVVFWRTSTSGARATSRRRAGKKTTRAHHGDLAALNDDAAVLTRLITFELKRGYKTAVVHDLLDGPPQKNPRPLEAFFLQAKEAAEGAGTPYWAVIHRRDRCLPLIYLPGQLEEELIDPNGYQFNLPVLRFWSYLPDGSALQVTAFRLQEFLDSVTPTDLKKLAQRKGVR